MKVLVVSHNVFSKTGNMGKTLSAYFNEWNVGEIAQFYVHYEVPTSHICHNYYRITDKEMIKSIFTRKTGTILTEKDINIDLADSRTDTGNTAKLYQKGRKRTPFIYFARNLWWKLGKWKTKKLLAWVDKFNPDIIFLASGDYYFIYDIALELAKYKSIPLVVSCMDDYYLYNKNEKKLGGKLMHRIFMKHVKKTMEYASCIYPICEKMGRDYEKLFNKPYHTLCTPSTIDEPLNYEKTKAISYIGNLDNKRNEALVQLGQAFKKIGCDHKAEYIDVYSAETNPETLKDLTEGNGIRFHGRLNSEEVLRVMGTSMAVIHTESFDEQARKIYKYSVSTKIADSLASGTPILAFGPAEMAAMEYINQNESAYCIVDEKDLEDSLKKFIEDEGLRERIRSNALALAKNNHDAKKNSRMIAKTMKYYI